MEYHIKYKTVKENSPWVLSNKSESQRHRGGKELPRDGGGCWNPGSVMQQHKMLKRVIKSIV